MSAAAGKGARLPVLEPEAMDPAQRAVYEQFTAPRPDGSRPKGTPYRLTLHWPEFTALWHETGETLRNKGRLPGALSEFAILLTASHWQCPHPLQTHARAAAEQGLPQALIDAAVAGRRPADMDADQTAIHDFCVALHTRHRVDDPTYAAVLERFGAFGAVELTAVVGYYTMVAMTLNAHGGS